MIIFESFPFLVLANAYLIDTLQPSNLGYLCNFGFLLD